MDAVSEAKAHLTNLIAKREPIEVEIAALHAQQDALFAEAPRPLDSRGPLVDEEDFPHAGVDIHGVAIIRNKLLRLQNDHKALMKQIESAMIAYHAALKRQQSAAQEEKEAPQEAKASGPQLRPPQLSGGEEALELQRRRKLKPFYLVDEVFEDSPASVSGLQVGDQILQFGTVTADNKILGDGTPSLARVVASSEGRPIQVLVERDGNIIALKLTPQVWAGQGKLGCHLQNV